jgi:nucleotide-binding universal stress UspA family protein
VARCVHVQRARLEALAAIDGILIPLAGRREEIVALRHAGALAARGGLPLTILHHVALRAPHDAVDSARSNLEELRSKAGSPARIEMIDGELAADTVVDELERHPRSIVCMPTHAWLGPGRLVWGSVAADIARLSPVPILLVGPNARPPTPDSPLEDLRITFAASINARRAFGPAGRVAAAFGLSIGVCGVAPAAGAEDSDLWADPPDKGVLTHTADSLEGVDAARHRAFELMHAPSPSAGLARMAAMRQSTMFAIATDTRPAGQRLLRGSVALEVAAKAAAPVLVVGPRCAVLPPSLDRTHAVGH